MNANTLPTHEHDLRKIPAAPISAVEQIRARTTGNMTHQNILTTIGNTPVVRINKLSPEGVNVYAKLEAFNPLGSVKDRLALGIIEAAERDGSLKPGQTVIEATSGNTGIGLAMVCAQKGYPLVVTMAENFSVERRRLMRYLGAKVVLTPASRMGTGMLTKAGELAEEHGWFLCRQFANEANADVHSATTAAEILADFPAGSLDYFVSGFGTGGTLKGIARELRKHSPSTRIIATEPENSPVVASGIAQAFTKSGDPAQGHPAFRPHPMQGWSPDFMSKLTNDVITDGLIDDLEPVAGAQALYLARELARQEGVFCGISGGATFAGALAVARRAQPGSNILCILPDTGERYLSTPLFDDIATEMNDEEQALSASTPGCRFDAPKEKRAPLLVSMPAADADLKAHEFIDAVVTSTDELMVMFSLEWCEFCWSVRKLFKALGIACRNIDLDSVEMQADNRGIQLRAALQQRTGKTTIPQLFFAGEHFGGCTDVFDAFKDGRMQSLLEAHGVEFNSEVSIDPYSLLPGWLHPR